ncbi:hypothetical protein Zmor_012632 [Zophobas morio]|uniref:Uncharacterized protein n=1 Tax=Zophobas morio TaxID=2755281 RepID=A0AA38MEJ9_9CUCU|nr:hypothetical protein Zmor_012632 [Zophobas morio]
MQSTNFAPVIDKIFPIRPIYFLFLPAAAGTMDAFYNRRRHAASLHLSISIRGCKRKPASLVLQHLRQVRLPPLRILQQFVTKSGVRRTCCINPVVIGHLTKLSICDANRDLYVSRDPASSGATCGREVEVWRRRRLAAGVDGAVGQWGKLVKIIRVMGRSDRNAVY